MEEHQAINMTDPVSKFCVSFVTIKVASKGMEIFVHSWNNHPVPSRFSSLILYSAIQTSLICKLPNIEIKFCVT